MAVYDAQWAQRRDVALGSGLDLLVEDLAQDLGGPVVLQDRELRALARSAAPPDGEPVALDPAHCHVTRGLIRRLSSLPAPARLEVGALPVRLVTGVTVGGDVLGYLTAEPAQPDDPETHRRLERAVGAIGLELAVEQRISEILGRDEQDFFDDLLAGRPVHRLVQRGYKLGYDLRQKHTPLAFAVDLATAGEKGVSLVYDTVLTASRAPVVGPGPVPIVGRDLDSVLAFVPGTDPEPTVALARLTLAAGRAAGLVVGAGTGPVCHEVAAYPDSVEKAKWAARVRLMTGNTDLVSSFDDLGICALFFRVGDRTELAGYVERWIGSLVDYDRRHHTQLTTTLRVLLENRSLRASAEALFVHTSTLKYRIKRINELLDGDYQEPETLFNLQVALRLHQMLQGLR